MVLVRNLSPEIPVGPVLPVAPVAPVLPVGPVNPVEPVLPVVPVGPVLPVGPVTLDADPVDPVGPVASGPVYPVGPAIPPYGSSLHVVVPSPSLKRPVTSSIPISPLARTGFTEVQFAAVSLRNCSCINGISTYIMIIYTEVPQSNAGPRGYVLLAEPPSNTVALYTTSPVGPVAPVDP